MQLEGRRIVVIGGASVNYASLIKKAVRLRGMRMRHYAE